MLRPRLIPVLLMEDGRLVKTVRFTSPAYVGDPLNAVRIFNEKLVDELIVADIGASRAQRGPDFPLIQRMASECSMPLCYVGGITNADQVEKLVGLGVEKVGVGSALVRNPTIVAYAAHRVGSQSLVGVLDVKARPGGFEVVTHGGRLSSGMAPEVVADEAERAGVGEIVLNSVDRDGTLTGFETNLAKRIQSQIQVPLTVIGGAGSLEDIRTLYRDLGIVGAGVGSLFVFKGRYRAVLLQYPSHDTRESLYSAAVV
jgi:imidazole glycerol-phosphate synthase subunit HisF